MTKMKMLAAVCSLFLLAACSDQADVKPSSGEVKEGANGEAMNYTAPFTGELVQEEVNQRPLLVTINNHPDARPQSGLGSADVVYEMLAEGDITRLLALYQTEIPDSIGPVRSARSYFIDLAKGLDAFYIAHGYSPEAKQMLENRVVDHINGMKYDGTFFKRSKTRVAPHNSYFDAENLQKASEQVDASLLYNKKVLYSFYEQNAEVQPGMTANDIEVHYNSNVLFNSTYHYDQSSKTYTRSSANAVTTDYLTNEPITLSNVLFFEMKHRVIDSEGRKDINMTSGGKAYIAQQGMVREVRWENKDGLLVAVEEDGTEAKLVPGQSWIHFIPASPGLDQIVTYSE